MRHLSCLVTTVRGLLIYGRLLCGEGLRRQGCSSAERKKEGPRSCAHSNFLAKSTFFLRTPDCSFDILTFNRITQTE